MQHVHKPHALPRHTAYAAGCGGGKDVERQRGEEIEAEGAAEVSLCDEPRLAHCYHERRTLVGEVCGAWSRWSTW